MTDTGAFRLYDPSELRPGQAYPDAWHACLKHEVRALAGNRCIRCKHPYENGKHGKGEWTPCDEHCTHAGPLSEIYGTTFAAWRILTVHHLDGNKRNCRWWNLAPLCQRCHLEIQGRVKVDQVYPWEHSEWFRPYAAGFYAWHYLHEDLTREEVAARQSELLALECLV